MSTSLPSNSFYHSNKWLLFLFLCLVTFLLLFVKKAFIESETAVFEFLQDRPEGSFFQILNTLQYLSIPLIYLWKLTVISFVIWVGCFMFGYKITYAHCWQASLVAEFIFLIPEIIKIAWLTWVVSDPTYFEIQMFYPLSLLSLADAATLDRRFVYPLKALNVFEAAYWVLLIYGIHYYARKKLRIAALIVASSYILLFLFWLLFYMVVYD